MKNSEQEKKQALALQKEEKEKKKFIENQKKELARLDKMQSEIERIRQKREKQSGMPTIIVAKPKERSITKPLRLPSRQESIKPIEDKRLTTRSSARIINKTNEVFDFLKEINLCNLFDTFIDNGFENLDYIRRSIIKSA